MTKELMGKDPFEESFDMVMHGAMVAMFALIMIPMLPAAQSAQRYFESQLYRGQSDSRTLLATDEEQHIVLSPPWMGAYFINDGPDGVKIRINDERAEPFLIKPRETLTLSYAGAEHRIYAIWYQCAPGETATVRVFGMY